MIQYKEYYPFGMETSESWTRMENLPANRYLFNGGSEWNSRAGIYETYYRGYDPALGRMTSIDPMALKYSSISPYNFAFNNPVSLNDPSGADPYYGHTTYTETTSSGYKFVDYWEVEYTPCGCGVVNEYAIDGSYHITPGSGNNWGDGYMSADQWLVFGKGSLNAFNNLSDTERFNVAWGYGQSYSGSDAITVLQTLSAASFSPDGLVPVNFSTYNIYPDGLTSIDLSTRTELMAWRDAIGVLLGQGNWPPSEDLEVRFQESVESNFLLPLRNRFSMKVFSDKSLVDLISYVNRYANFPYKDDVSKIDPQYQDGLPDSWSNPVNITLRGFYISIDTELVYKKPFVDGFNGEYDYNGDFGAPRFNTSFISTEGKIINLFFHYQVFETF